MFLVKLFPEFYLLLHLLNSHIPEGLIPLPLRFNAQLCISRLFIKFLFVVGVVSPIVLHIAASIDGPFEPAELTVRSVIQCSFSRFFIVKSAITLANLVTALLEPIAVIVFFKVGLAEHVVGFVYFLEFDIVSFISIWVVLFGEMVKCLLNLR
jgi:hypothetical protein